MVWRYWRNEQKFPDTVCQKSDFLDGHNNPGFSGGPVVFKEPNKNEFKVALVISGYRYTHEPIFIGDQQVPLAYHYNTGIIVSYGVKHAVDVINENPIGLPIRA